MGRLPRPRSQIGWPGRGVRRAGGKRYAGGDEEPRPPATSRLRGGGVGLPGEAKMKQADARFAGSIPATYDTHLGPLFFEPYAADLSARWTSMALTTVS